MITEGQLTRISQRDFHPRLCMTVSRSVSEKSNKITWHSEWMPRLEMFSEKSWQALSSQNLTWEGVGSEEEDASKRRRFWDGANLHLGAMRRLFERKRERERETSRKVPINNNIKRKKRMVRMHEKCINMWHVTIKTSWAQPNPNLPAHKVPT